MPAEDLAPCPDEDDLADLAVGLSPPSRSDALRDHVLGCEGCRRALALLAAALQDPDDEAGRDEGLSAGARVGRFEIVRLLGVGSVGAVWEARDTELDRLVALKTLRPDGRAPDPAALARLQREALALARLSHPNVVTVHEVLVHQGGVFLALELVGGGTLRGWLAERLRTLDEILGVFEAAGRGLSAAHAAGLVHRDFKPDNVLVGEDGRVRVTDFGLASPPGARRPDAQPEAELRVDLTRSGALVGTPAYMAPAQLRGEPADARADVFAFAVSLWEAVTGTRPFAGATVHELLANIESERTAPPAPGRSLPAWLEGVLRKQLRAGASGWQSVDALWAALGRSRARARWRGLGPVAIGLALLLAGLLAAALRPGRAPPLAPRHRTSIAALPLANATGSTDAGWLSTALAALLSDELAAGGALRVVPRRAAARAVADLRLRGEPAVEELPGLSAALDADLLLAGSYRTVGEGALRLDLRLYDGTTGELRGALAEAGEAGQPGPLVARAAERLRALLGAPQAWRVDQGHAGVGWPADAATTRLLAEALAAQDRHDLAGALQFLERAAGRAPGSARVLAALAEACFELGDPSRAAEAALRALAAAPELEREARLRIERLAAAGDWRRALELSRALWTFFPDDPEHGLQLASDLHGAGLPGECSQVLAELRKLPITRAQAPRLGGLEALCRAQDGESVTAGRSGTPATSPRPGGETPP